MRLVLCGTSTLLCEWSNAFLPSRVCLSWNPCASCNSLHRKHYVSSDTIRPTWKTFASQMQADQRLHFSLHLMTGEMMNLRLLFFWFAHSSLANFPNDKRRDCNHSGYCLQILPWLLRMLNGDLINRGETCMVMSWNCMCSRLQLTQQSLAQWSDQCTADYVF